jgi:hypothetical protein
MARIISAYHWQKSRAERNWLEATTTYLKRALKDRLGNLSFTLVRSVWVEMKSCAP